MEGHGLKYEGGQDECGQYEKNSQWIVPPGQRHQPIRGLASHLMYRVVEVRVRGRRTVPGESCVRRLMVRRVGAAVPGGGAMQDRQTRDHPDQHHDKPEPTTATSAAHSGQHDARLARFCIPSWGM